MKIFLMRHGEAGYDAPNDDLRALTDRGRQQIRDNFARARERIGNPAALYSSPIRRARQTASLVQELVGSSHPIVEVDWLVHGSRPVDALAALAELPLPNILLFSHQPFASRLVEQLCGLEPGAVSMNTASIVGMEADPVAAGLGTLLWQIP